MAGHTSNTDSAFESTGLIHSDDDDREDNPRPLKRSRSTTLNILSDIESETTSSSIVSPSYLPNISLHGDQISMNQNEIDAIAAGVRAALQLAAPNYDKMLTFVTNNYKECKNLNSREKHEIEFLIPVAGQLANVDDPTKVVIRKQLMMYVQVMQNSWTYATLYMKEVENKEMGLPVIPIQVAPQVVYQNLNNYQSNRRGNNCGKRSNQAQPQNNGRRGGS